MDNRTFIPDEKMHTGHRSRMREKFLLHGKRFFDTYELLEMLLYYVIPYKDTNPIAKRLLAEFGSLDGVLSARREELMRVVGIGERAADFICSVGGVEDLLFLDTTEETMIFNDYLKTGKYLADYVRNIGNRCIVALFLDNSMRKIEIKTIYRDLAGDKEIKPKAFVDAAILSGASVAIIAQNYPYGPKFPSPHDYENNKMITETLATAGVLLLENYVVSGTKFIGITRVRDNIISAVPEIQSFLDSKEQTVVAADLTYKNNSGEVM